MERRLTRCATPQLPPFATEGEVRAEFSKFGQIRDVPNAVALKSAK